jgi:hypothetical protein
MLCKTAASKGMNELGGVQFSLKDFSQLFDVASEFLLLTY